RRRRASTTPAPTRRRDACSSRFSHAHDEPQVGDPSGPLLEPGMHAPARTYIKEEVGPEEAGEPGARAGSGADAAGGGVAAGGGSGGAAGRGGRPGGR